MAGALVISAITATTAMAQSGLELKKIGTYKTGIFDQGASEIVAHDRKTQRLFVVNAQAARIDVVDISNPTSPVALAPIDVTPYGVVANSVDVHDGVVAVAVQNAVKTDPGKVVFFNAKGQFLSAVQVGALPDMLTFTPDGDEVLVANEAEPSDDYTADPEGSVSIIDLVHGARKVTQKNVRTVNFASFNNAALDPSLRIFGPNATVAQDLEPEYIAVLD
ncbi:MAG: choice-of-anchor I domain-containing protein, partial [bacterium]